MSPNTRQPGAATVVAHLYSPMKTARSTALLLLLSQLFLHVDATLVSKAGQVAVIPTWDLQSTAVVGNDLGKLSRDRLDTESWYHAPVSKCTLIGCLIEAKVYNETELFFSDNLRKLDENKFLVPWIYRSEFTLQPTPGQHFFLQTNGISSRADIYLNGKMVANSSEQAGSYVGRRYDITDIVRTENVLAIKVYPTDYYRDLALGWVDWNPWPTDNGTGVWRDVEIKQTGPVVLDPLRVVPYLGAPLTLPVKVSLRARLHNLEDRATTIEAVAQVVLESGGTKYTRRQLITIPPKSSLDIFFEEVIENPQIWWPRQWGDQPLYTANLTIQTIDGHISDHASATFGLRSVTRQLNAHNDTIFFVNNRPFQVIGAGYTPNMFLRFDPAKWETELRYALDLGLNTIRLEGKNEHPELYNIADRLGMMLLAGWECCDKWEAWDYNPDLAVSPTPVWTDEDYAIAHESMFHETLMMQAHPSVLGFLIGSDYWPDERATSLYLEAARKADFQLPVIGAASKRGFSMQTGPSGMRMDGPYDWVPPNYWTTPDTLGTAAGFASELSAGVGTPGSLSSLEQFLTADDMDDLWRQPNKSLFHMSRAGSPFDTREIYNAALWARWGAPTSLDDYLMKAQLMDYEATRAQFEAFRAHWGDGGVLAQGSKGPATGMIYWMLNNAWPGLHWSLWDYYMRPGGSYFGAKVAGREEHVAFSYATKDVWAMNRALEVPIGQEKRRIEVSVLGVDGKEMFKGTSVFTTKPNWSGRVESLREGLGKVNDTVFLRLILTDEKGKTLSRNIYWLAPEIDVLDWEQSDWYFTPVTKYADFTALNKLEPADITIDAVVDGDGVFVTVENHAMVPAFFIKFDLVDEHGRDVLPLTWDENYVTLWPKEKLTLRARVIQGRKWEPVQLKAVGKNTEKTIRLKRK